MRVCQLGCSLLPGYEQLQQRRQMQQRQQRQQPHLHMVVLLHNANKLYNNTLSSSSVGQPRQMACAGLLPTPQLFLLRLCKPADTFSRMMSLLSRLWLPSLYWHV